MFNPLLGLSPRATAYMTTIASSATGINDTNVMVGLVNSPHKVSAFILDGSSPLGPFADKIIVDNTPTQPVMTYKMPLNRTSTAALKIRKSFKKL